MAAYNYTWEPERFKGIHYKARLKAAPKLVLTRG